MDCVPPLHVRRFGDDIVLSPEYRQALYEAYPFYTTEEIVGTSLGFGIFLSESDWWKEQKGEDDDSEEEDDDSEEEDQRDEKRRRLDASSSTTTTK